MANKVRGNVASSMNDKPKQEFQLTDASLMRRRVDKLRDVSVFVECPKKRTRAAVQLNGVMTFDSGLGRYGEPRGTDTQVGLGSSTVFCHNNNHPRWYKCGRDAKRLKEIALLYAWMRAIREINGRWGKTYGSN
jgi:hypothetical protein